VSLGVARGALDEVNRQAISRRAQMRGTLLDDHIDMGDLAAADALLRGACAGLLEILDECWDLAHSGEPIDRALQARAFLAAQHGSDVAVETCATAHRLGGGAAVYRTNPLLRALRDVQTARQHAMFNRGPRPHLGRTIAGSDEAHPAFVV
jgi:indole-3-acetate monooxygenase